MVGHIRGDVRRKGTFLMVGHVGRRVSKLEQEDQLGGERDDLFLLKYKEVKYKTLGYQSPLVFICNSVWWYETTRKKNLPLINARHGDILCLIRVCLICPPVVR